MREILHRRTSNTTSPASRLHPASYGRARSAWRRLRMTGAAVLFGLSGFPSDAASCPSGALSARLLACAPTLVLEDASGVDFEVAVDPIVSRLVASVRESFGLPAAVTSRLASPAEIVAVRDRRKSTESDPLLMRRLLAVLGVAVDPDAGKNVLGVAAAWEAPTDSSPEVLWIVDDRLELSDLVEICREAARGCAQSMADRAAREPDLAASSEAGEAMDVASAVDLRLGDRALARSVAREAEARYFADEALRQHAEEVARRGFLPPMPRDRWATPSQTAWQVAHDRFADGPGRDYLVRALDRRGSTPGQARSGALDRAPRSTTELLHGIASTAQDRTSGGPPPTVAASGDPLDLPRHPAYGPLDSTAFVFGELRTELVLRLAADPLRALGAAVGWRDDRIAWTDDLDEDGSPAPIPVTPDAPTQDPVARGMVVWTARMETENDARELVDALRKLLERRYVTQVEPVAAVTRDSRDLAWCRAKVGDRDRAFAGRSGAVVRFAISVERPLPEWARSWAAGALKDD